MTTRRDVLVNVADGAADDLSPSAGQALAGLVRRAVVRALDAESAPGAEISVTLLGDAEIRVMNREYLARDGITDVIAFSLGDDGRPGADGGPSVLGDIYIGFHQAARQARELEIALEEEVARLAIHGTLHVLGHDHPEGDDRVDSPMYRLQERLLQEVMGRR